MVVVGIYLVCCGCQVQNSGNHNLLPEARVRAIVEGTSKDQVQRLLGRPTQVRYREPDEQEVWVYRYRKSVLSYASSSGEHVQLQLDFNDKGDVARVHRASWAY